MTRIAPSTILLRSPQNPARWTLPFTRSCGGQRRLLFVEREAFGSSEIVYHIKQFSTSAVRWRNEKHWTREEDQVLTECRQQNLSRDEIQKRLPHRSRHGISARWSKITPRDSAGNSLFPDPRYSVCTLEKMQKIKELRESGMSFVDITARIPGANRGSITNKYYTQLRGELDKRPRRRIIWTEAMCARLRYLRDIEKRSWADIASEFGTSLVAAQRSYNRLTEDTRAKKKRYSPPWTDDETEILQRLIREGKSSKDMQASLPGRSGEAIQFRRDILIQGSDQDRRQVRKEVIKMKDNGASWDAIQKRFAEIPRLSLRHIYYYRTRVQKADESKRSESL